MAKKESKGGMRSARMPQDHFERNEGKLSAESKLKYAGEFSNPADLDKASEGLANYVKKHKMKY
jgi:hypothetical protein